MLLPSNTVRISHIGSTAIAGIRAKNIIDVLIEIPMEERLKTSFQTGDFVPFEAQNSAINDVWS